ncbi:ankyrin repeat domain-containing protein [Parashewanella spongiae]|uniref:Ankyrin repeat domain-containing protein n=1 Tax=Parashewanella spongiae TaxID=342950 RepID=A0A3A6UML2_9GAMM|nr:ankyrin repeat domain-containing protein [Parashewanella spongiae]MCL1077393.1 ankyrin repeat domain-containing protein [Parashewanella spongiae]RJY18982.1 ankyrin repeat domain-containing protein [Parashewanella spongiae]
MALTSTPASESVPITLFCYSEKLISISADSKTLTKLTASHSQKSVVHFKFVNKEGVVSNSRKYCVSCEQRAKGIDLKWVAKPLSIIVEDFHSENEKLAIKYFVNRLNGKNYWNFYNEILQSRCEAVRSFLEDGINLNLHTNEVIYPVDKYAFPMKTRFKLFSETEFLFGNPDQSVFNIQSSQTALHLAVMTGSTEISKLLVTHGAPINAQNRHGNTPLIGAILCAHEEMALFFIEQGCDVDIKNSSKCLALGHAIKKKLIKVVKAIAPKTKHINEPSSKSGSFLALAASLGYKEIVSILLENGANPSHESNSLLPVHFAVLNKHLNTAKLMISQIRTRKEFDDLEFEQMGRQSLTSLIKSEVPAQYQEELMVLLRNKLATLPN